MRDAPLITAIICTRDRSASLRRTLESIAAAATHLDAPWELLIVDNGSSDDTQAAAQGFAPRLPLRVVREETPGLSNARNRGVDAARGKYIIWTDDDVLVHEQWLAAYARAFAAHPSADLFGGRTKPHYLEPVTPWFTRHERELAGLLALRDSPEWDAITPERIPWGLNFALRTEVQRRYRYDPALGVAPGRRRGGEEVAVLCAALGAGSTGVWVWDALVHHLIPPERQTLAYIDQFFRAVGYDYPLVPLHPSALRTYAGLARYMARRARRGLLRRPGGWESWVGCCIDWATIRGMRDRMRDNRAHTAASASGTEPLLGL